MSKRSLDIIALPLTNKPANMLGREDPGRMVLEVSVDYEEGGTSFLSGNSYERGFYLHFTPVTLRDGFRSYTIGGALSGIKGLIEPAKRFNAKRLEQLAAGALESELYQRLLAHQQGKGIVLEADHAAALVSA